MKLRRLIAAATALFFITIWCAPAFAGARTLLAAPTDEGCCCAEEETTTHQTVQEIPCRCASCACSLSDAQPFAPLSATPAAMTTLSAVATTSDVAWFDAQPVPGDVANVGARGPPLRAPPPLYLLYDTWLI